ncbi:hypothetical protein D3P07_23200 [Paenibacillus sp. 1011MAR3C5]|uniref:hypothetical protein n=1 Tax=Paenibacillus sp. 1011MAR3C5 TaxID=1675787 RepID=UPI000E6D2160|nr:hypothetical protein [Paenibacillus sp. 1011MAR3C5]RJE84278.1 hypothetical protein D3P07_23200 [Paenibacillus sp. 1011MAR3C5]
MNGESGESVERTFTKDQLLRARCWSAREKNLLDALLEVGSTFSIQQVKQLAQTFTNRRVE